MKEAGIGGDQPFIADDQAAELAEPGEGARDYPTLLPLSRQMRPFGLFLASPDG
jgi:hypothetical protein